MDQTKKVLITGGAGFAGANLIRYLLNKYSRYKIINFDVLTESGALNRLQAMENNPNYLFVKGDITSQGDVEYAFEQYKPDYVIHFASQSYIDRNMDKPGIFMQTNVIGTQNLITNARDAKIDKLLHISTSKVYGSANYNKSRADEETMMKPCDPYAASKAAADLVIQTAFRAHNLNVNILRPTNLYGPYQFPEKLIPTVIENIRRGKEIPVYGSGKAYRDWLYIDDYCNAVDIVLHKGVAGETYNLSSGTEITNIELIRELMRLMELGEMRMEFFKERLSDESYPSVDSIKIRKQLGWKPQIELSAGLKKTVDWFNNHTEWVEEIYSGEYLRSNSTN